MLLQVFYSFGAIMAEVSLVDVFTSGDRVIDILLLRNATFLYIYLSIFVRHLLPSKS